ncbi:hypothetical protein [Zhihengliuella sp.]|uniref:hypothetical protein n=1 Tax=Zhihengliuella sp. TaxID=1954483 RepID=UPI00281151F8|nr:hypothetical protein [Zhihengliuella sp.]
MEIWEPEAEAVDAKFEAAWAVFAHSCGRQWANEPTFQAWFAHYLIGQFGFDRVGREAIFNEDRFRLRPRPRTEVKPDIVVMRKPGIMLPHYANKLAKSTDLSGIGLMRHLAVVSELKVGVSTANGLDRRAIRTDIEKLSHLLDEHEYVNGTQAPLAYACVLDNHPKRRTSRVEMEELLADAGVRPDVRLLFASPEQRPSGPSDGRLHWGVGRSPQGATESDPERG